MSKTVGMGAEVKKTDLNSLKKENAALTKANAKLQGDFDELSKSNSDLRGKLKEAETYAETADKANADLQTRVAELTAKLTPSAAAGAEVAAQ